SPTSPTSTATSTSTTPAPPAPGATRLADLPTTAVAPRIAADGDVAAWSTASSISVVTGDGPVQTFATPSRPRGLSVGHVDGQPPVVVFALCPPGKHGSKRRHGSCDLYRLSRLDASGTVVPLTDVGPGLSAAGASTGSADELSPSLAGRFLVFARWPKGKVPGYLVRRDLRTGHERRLPSGSRGECHHDCSWDGVYANGPTQAAASGNAYAQIWTFFGGPDGFGVDDNDVAIKGRLTGRPRDHIVDETFVDGAGDGGAFIDDLKLAGGVVQVTNDIYDPDDAPPKPGTHLDLLRTTGKHYSTYDDPVGRRIVSAAATPTTLWLVLEAQALPAGTSDDDMPEDVCGATVHGCVVERMPAPAFVPGRD
ncbi:MAG: hypothetical protein REI11_18615, partial [Patulibacter sp.]|nr:hypothetical protein [Patulibacter sp.]